MSKPQLWIDNSKESKKSLTIMEKSGKEFEAVHVKRHEDCNPPVLFCKEGVFEGYLSIEVYANSKLGRMK